MALFEDNVFTLLNVAMQLATFIVTVLAICIIMKKEKYLHRNLSMDALLARCFER